MEAIYNVAVTVNEGFERLWWVLYYAPRCINVFVNISISYNILNFPV
jgi:hypothetical protein